MQLMSAALQDLWGATSIRSGGRPLSAWQQDWPASSTLSMHSAASRLTRAPKPVLHRAPTPAEQVRDSQDAYILPNKGCQAADDFALHFGACALLLRSTGRSIHLPPGLISPVELSRRLSAGHGQDG